MEQFSWTLMETVIIASTGCFLIAAFFTLVWMFFRSFTRNEEDFSHFVEENFEGFEEENIWTSVNLALSSKDLYNLSYVGENPSV